MIKLIMRLPACLIVSALILSGCTESLRKAHHASRAEKFYQAGDWDQAKIEYLKVIQADPKNAQAYARVGQMWADEGAAIRAGAFLLRARDLAPNDNGNRLQLAKVYQAVGQVREATNEANTVLKEEPGNGTALLVYSQSAVRPDASPSPQAVLDGFPNKESASWKLASAIQALRKRDLTTAERLLEEAKTADPKLPDVRSAMAVLALSKKDTNRAKEELKAAADLTPARSREKRSYAEFLVQSGLRDEAVAYAKSLTEKARDFVGAWIVQAEVALANKKYEEADSILGNVFSRDPDNLDGKLLKAQVLLAQKAVKPAIDLLQSLDRMYPNSSPVKFRLANAYVQAGDLAQAMTALDQVLGLNPTNREAALLLAQLKIQSGSAMSAIPGLEAMVREQGDNTAALFILTSAYQAAGRAEDGANLMREQLKKTPGDANAHFVLGLILSGQKKGAEARKEFEQVLAINPQNAAAADQLLSLDLQDGNTAQAQARADAFRTSTPNSAAGYILQARALLAEKKYDEGEKALQQAIEKDPNSTTAYNLLVGLYLSKNELPQAVAQLNTVLQKNPDNPSVLTLIGLVQTQMQDFKNAQATYEKVLVLNPNSVVALNNLASLYTEKIPNLSRAGELARRAHDLAADNGPVADTLGWILYMQKDYAQAVELLRQAAAKTPVSAETLFHLGMAEYMMGRTSEAKGAFERALATPGEFPSKELANQQLASLQQGSVPGAELSAADLEKASASSDPVALRRAAVTYEKQGNPQKAAAAYEKAFAANPRLSEIPFALANLYAGPLHDNDRALIFAKKARELNPSDPKTTAAVGKIALRAGNNSWAYSLLQEGVRQSPDDMSLLHDFGWAAYNLGKLEEAKSAMTRVASGRDETVGGDAKRFLLLLPLDTLQKDTPASPQVDESLSSDKNYVPALMAQAAAFLRKGDPKSAGDIYNSLLQRLPDFAPAQKRLAAIYATDPAMLDKAADLAARARRSLGDDAELAGVNGLIAYQRKDFPRAMQALQAAAAKAPLDAESLFYLGMSQQAAGRKAEAQESLTKSLAAGLAGPHTDEARRALAELQANKSS